MDVGVLSGRRVVKIGHSPTLAGRGSSYPDTGNLWVAESPGELRGWRTRRSTVCGEAIVPPQRPIAAMVNISGPDKDTTLLGGALGANGCNPRASSDSEQERGILEKVEVMNHEVAPRTARL